MTKNNEKNKLEMAEKIFIWILIAVAIGCLVGLLVWFDGEGQHDQCDPTWHYELLSDEFILCQCAMSVDGYYSGRSLSQKDLNWSLSPEDNCKAIDLKNCSFYGFSSGQVEVCESPNDCSYTTFIATIGSIECMLQYEKILPDCLRNEK